MSDKKHEILSMLLENAGVDPEKILGERQKTTSGLSFSGEEKPVRQGSFKLSKKALDMWKEEGGISNPEEMLFKAEREYISKIPYDRLPEVWGADNMADAQDVIAGSPKRAMQMFLKNIGKIAPKLGGAVRKNPDNIPLWFYATILRVSGREMADVILKKWFMTKSEDVEIDKSMGDIIERVQGKVKSGGNTGYSIDQLLNILVRTVNKGTAKEITMIHDELKAKGADMHVVDAIIRNGKLPAGVKRIKSLSEDDIQVSESRIPSSHPWGSVASSAGIGMKDLEKLADKFGIDLSEKPKMWWKFADKTEQKKIYGFIQKMNPDVIPYDEFKKAMMR